MFQTTNQTLYNPLEASTGSNQHLITLGKTRPACANSWVHNDNDSACEKALEAESSSSLVMSCC